jgi:hypothetical protein
MRMEGGGHVPFLLAERARFQRRSFGSGVAGF